MDRETTDVFRSRSDSTKPELLKVIGDLSVRDVELTKALTESIKIGRITPLLKEELKCQIQARRHSEGKGELTVKFEDPPLILENELSPESLARLDKRRAQNRKASRKLRIRKRDEEKLLMNKLAQLDVVRRGWQAEIDDLTQEKIQLQELLHEHPCIHIVGQSELSESNVAVHDFNESFIENSESVASTHEPYSKINSCNNKPCLSNLSIDTIQNRITPDNANGPPYYQTDCMLGMNNTNVMSAIDIRPEEMEQFNTYSEYPLSPTDTISSDTDITNVNYFHQGSDVQNLDESDPFTTPNTNRDYLHSPAEQQTAEHFLYPETIELAVCGSLDLNQSLQLEDMICKYNWGVPLDHSCLDMSYFNMATTGLPVTP